MKILIVEDELITATALKSLIEKKGHTVLEIVRTGAESVEKANSLEPELIFMDILLADKIDGIEAASRIREKIMTPIIFVTASSDDFTFKKIDKITNCEFIKKPYVSTEIYKILMKYENKP